MIVKRFFDIGAVEAACEPKMDTLSDTKVGNHRAAAEPRFTWAGGATRVFILILIGALVFVLAYEWDWWVGAATLQRTDDAYLQADTTPLAAKIPGYVNRVLVQDFQRVLGGDVIVEIVDDDYRAQLDQAQANVVTAGAAIDNIEQQKRLQETLVKQAEAEIQASEADVTRYHLEAVRQETLLSKSCAGTPQLTEQAVDNEKRAIATLTLNRAKLDQQRQQLNVLESQKAQAAAALNGQKAARNLAAINLGYTRIVAPTDGMVSERRRRGVEVGRAAAVPFGAGRGDDFRFVDARLMMALGFTLAGSACFMAGQLTHDWVSEDFLRSQLLQAVGQSFGLTSLVWFSLKHLEPSEIFTFGAVLQTGRLFGAQLGSAFIQTFVRVREQTYSNLIGLHVNAGSFLTDQRLEYYAKIVRGRSIGDRKASARATALLARAVQNQAYVLAYIDGFMVLGFAVIGGLLLMLLVRDPPAHLEQPATRR